MEATVIDFIFSTLMGLSAQYPDAAWLVTALSVVMTGCGLCAVATVWMPVPKEPTGLYAVFYRWAHALAAHFGQNKGAVADGKSETVKAEVKAVTGEWSYTYRGETFTEPGEWVHLPAGEAGNLLLWIKSVEEAQ